MVDTKRMTQSEIYSLAIKKNYQALYNCITMHDMYPNISWGEAMEKAALVLSEQNAELTAEIIRIHQTSIVKIIDGKQVHMDENICNAPGCTRNKRGPTYCDKHRIQVNTHGKLRPDLERLPPKNLRK